MGVGKPLGSLGYRLVRIKALYDVGRITRCDGIRRDIMGNNRAGSNNAILTNNNPFAQYRAIAYPGVIFQSYRDGIPGDRAIVDVMPVRISQIHTIGQHAIIPNDDLRSAANSHTRADQTIVPDIDSSLTLIAWPYRQPHFSIG